MEKARGWGWGVVYLVCPPIVHEVVWRLFGWVIVREVETETGQELAFYWEARPA